MTLFPRLAACALAALLAMLSLTTQAGDGHDHGEAPAAAAGPALPRFAAISDTVELVGVLDGHDLSLWLDHAADNSPVTDARLELMVGGVKVEVDQQEPGVFMAELAQEPAEGELAIVALVVTGQQRVPLSAELDIHHASAPPSPAASTPWVTYASWGGGALLLLALLGWAIARTRATTGHA